MKKQLIAVLVGGLILFIWQFLSWSLLPIHANEMAYTSNQDAILESLNENLDENGTYFIPRANPGASQAEVQAMADAHAGKPWAVVHYRTAYNTNMGMNMVRGLVSNFAAVFLLVWLLGQFRNVNIKSGVVASLSVGTVGFFVFAYLGAIWFETAVLGHLLDTLVQFGLVGAWLGYYLKTRVEV